MRISPQISLGPTSCSKTRKRWPVSWLDWMKSYRNRQVTPDRGGVEEQPEEVTILHNNMVHLIMSAGPFNLCFIESDNHPTEDRATSSELKTIWNGSPELDQELGFFPTTADPGELKPLSRGVVDTRSYLGSYCRNWTKTRQQQKKLKGGRPTKTKRGKKVWLIKAEATKDYTPRLRIHSFPRPRRIRYVTTVVTRAMSIGHVLPIKISTLKQLLWMWNSRRWGNRGKRRYDRDKTIERIIWWLDTTQRVEKTDN